jgi:hypothetical protein
LDDAAEGRPPRVPAISPVAGDLPPKGVHMIGAIILGIVAGFLGRLLMPG